MDTRAINGIIIHELPKEYETDALNQFSNPKEIILCTKYDKIGLRIYFKQYRAAHESIMNKKVLVRGTLYNVYSLVTNLTFHGIRPYAKEYTIKALFKNLGSVINLYEIQENHNDRNSLITDDYRIILDIPEVMANFDLNPLTPAGVDRQFSISFFCRLCRRNGHKQHQCLNVRSGTSSKSVSRQTSHDTSKRIETVHRQNVGEGIDRTLNNKVLKTIPEKFKFERERVLEPERRNLKSVKTDKEPAKCARKNEKCESYHKTTPNSYNRISSYSKPKISFVRSRMLLRDNESSSVSKPSVESSRCYGNIHRFSKFSFHEKKSEDTATKGRASTATNPSSGARISLSGKRMEPLISRILPPDMKVEDIQKIIIKANSLGSQNLPFHIKDKLTRILHWNMENPASKPRKWETKQLQAIRMLLNKANRDKKEEGTPTRCCCDDPASSSKSDPASSFKSDPASSIGERKDLQSTVSIGLSPKIRRRRISISQGVIEIIDKVAGQLKPELLTNFLLQVRGRKNVLEIVEHFTEDKDALVAQLKKVVSIYYRSGKKGAEEEQDIRWIQNLCLRLEGNTKSSTNLDDIQHASDTFKCQGRQTFISSSIKEAIFKVDGELKPADLFNFLVNVRGKKNLSEVVRNFTQDSNVLVNQLGQVISAYYRSGQKDAVSEHNVQWIKGVCQRLLQGRGISAKTTDLLIKTENPYDMLPKVEPTIQNVFMKSDPFIVQSFIKTEHMDE